VVQDERDVEIHVSSPAPDDCEATRPLLTAACEAYSVSAAILPYAHSPLLITEYNWLILLFLQTSAVLLQYVPEFPQI
jgi:hypothetical protein